MPKTNDGFVLSYILVLVSTSIFSHKPVAFGSPVQEQRFHRPNPLRHFKFYKGGYDIRNKHYWASAAFTGVHGYAIGGVWMLCGLVFGSYMVLAKSFNGSSSSVTENSNYLYII
ncbi:hypothetical protein RHMOL_Rhmol08G0109800 [Rhododendron molle]|uniref:Uncharacterized protein n=1 Tax=Rhododendron molle TaxID=49168 RepID=A0ACC0MLZ1_RHOML|nr:hypothetical protein RHMOL_Rhmol08G0109800 [Rhododendron molle]